MVDRDAEAKGLRAIDLSLLELLEGEALASTLLGVVADGLAADYRPDEPRNRTGKHALGLGQPVFPPPVLASSLIEPSPDTPLVSSLVVPVLVEVGVGDLDAKVGPFLPIKKTLCQEQSLSFEALTHPETIP